MAALRACVALGTWLLTAALEDRELMDQERAGAWLYEQDGPGKLWLPAASFSPDAHGGHGGGAAWSACTGVEFDTGTPMWSAAEGSRIDKFRVTGRWHLRVGTICRNSSQWPRSDLTREYAAADGTVLLPGLSYLEEVVDGIWLHESGGDGKVFLSSDSFSPNWNSGRGGVPAWDACASALHFDNGRPLWTSGGSRVGSLRVVGGWVLLASSRCGKSSSLRSLALSGEHSESEEVTAFPGLAYLEQAVDGIEVFEIAGGGRLLVTADSFAPNFNSGRGGAPGWDACAGGTFDNGEPLWSPGLGSRIGGFAVTGGWRVRAGASCSKSLGSSSTHLSDPVDAGGIRTFPGLSYVEAVVDGVELFEEGGSGTLFVPAALFTYNANSGRGGISAWDACSRWEFDNGDPVWLDGQGSHVVGFQVMGGWRVRASRQCAKTFDYQAPELSGPYDASSGQQWMPGLLYLESATPGVRLLAEVNGSLPNQAPAGSGRGGQAGSSRTLFP